MSTTSITKSMASVGKSLTKKQVRQMIRDSLNAIVEHKYFHTAIAIAQSSTISLSDLTLVAQGDAGTDRTGQEIHVTRLKFHFSAVVGDVTNVVRFVVFWWHPDSNSEVPTVGDVMMTASPVSVTLPLKPSKFTIVADEILLLSTANSIALVSRDIKLNNNVMFIPGVNLGLDHLYAMYWSDSAAATHPTITASCIIIFTDL
jgi:hypothetical protein